MIVIFVEINGKITWKCKSGNDKSLAKKILKKMKISENDITELLEECDEHGGHCDCEILFNAKDDLI